VGLRKAVAAIQYVSVLTSFAFDEEADSMSSSAPVQCDSAVFTELQSLKPEGLLKADECPAGTPKTLRKPHALVRDFIKLKEYLLAELAAAQDTSLGFDNQDILQTLSQIEILSTTELYDAFRRLRPKATKAARKKKTKEEVMAMEAPLPRGFVCPITQGVMEDPVIAADGHSYERAAIEKWFKTKRAPPTSPSTNLALPHTFLVPNRALKAAIQDHLEKNGRFDMGAEHKDSDSDSDRDSDGDHDGDHPLAMAAALVRSKRPRRSRRPDVDSRRRSLRKKRQKSSK
jgi:hypothetical protein